MKKLSVVLTVVLGLALVFSVVGVAKKGQKDVWKVTGGVRLGTETVEGDIGTFDIVPADLKTALLNADDIHFSFNAQGPVPEEEGASDAKGRANLVIRSEDGVEHFKANAGLMFNYSDSSGPVAIVGFEFDGFSVAVYITDYGTPGAAEPDTVRFGAEMVDDVPTYGPLYPVIGGNTEVH